MVSQLSDSELNEKYITKNFTHFVTEMGRLQIPVLCQEIKKGRYQFISTTTPEWTVEEKSHLIESIIVNIPITHIVYYEFHLGKYKIIDGNQRIKAIDDFYNNRFRLNGLKAYPELDGRTYETLPSAIHKAITRRSINTIGILRDIDNHPPLEEVLEMLRKRYDQMTEEDYICPNFDLLPFTTYCLEVELGSEKRAVEYHPQTEMTESEWKVLSDLQKEEHLRRAAQEYLQGLISYSFSIK